MHEQERTESVNGVWKGNSAEAPYPASANHNRAEKIFTRKFPSQTHWGAVIGGQNQTRQTHPPLA